MKKYLLIAVLFAVAAPCAAQFKDVKAAKTALSSAKAKDRLDAIGYLGSLRSEDGYGTLAQHFQTEGDAYLRVQIVEALNVSGSSWAYKCLVQASSDGNKVVRRSAAAALAGRAGEAGADARIMALASDPEESVRLALVRGLAVRQSTSAVSAIGAVLADRKGTLRSRQTAAETLARLKTPAGDAELLKHLSDSDPKIKAAAMSRRPGSKAKPAAKKK
jgi:HEAT repeat protein